MWATPDFFNFGEFNTGDFFGAVSDKVLAETLTRVLYPDDSTASGRSLLDIAHVVQEKMPSTRLMATWIAMLRGKAAIAA